MEQQDASLVLPALIGQSVRDALKRVDAYVETQGAVRLSEEDLAVWGEIVQLLAASD